MSLPKKYEHFKTCCISLYNEDIKYLDSLVAKLKKQGYHRANKSAVLRAALANVKLDDIKETL